MDIDGALPAGVRTVLWWNDTIALLRSRDPIYISYGR